MLVAGHNAVGEMHWLQLPGLYSSQVPAVLEMEWVSGSRTRMIANHPVN